MSERNYYVLRDDNCRFPAMTAEQVLEAIAEATGNVPERVDDAFITKIKESNHNTNLTFWKGTETEFNALGVTAPVYKVGVDSNGKLYFTPMAAEDVYPHASTHATGGDDEITPSSIGAAAQSNLTTATLAAASWSGSAAPYSYTLAVSGVTATSAVEILPGANITAAQLEALQAANIQDGGQATGSITLKAFGDKPGINLPIRVIVRGDL